MALPTIHDKPVRQARTVVFAQMVKAFNPELKLQLNRMGHSFWVSLDSEQGQMPETWMLQFLCLYQWELCEVMKASSNAESQV